MTANVILTTTGIVKSLSVLQTGVNKKGKTWQLFGYTIEVSGMDVKMSAFKNFNVPIGATVEVGYSETPNPKNPEYNYMNIESIKVINAKPTIQESQAMQQQPQQQFQPITGPVTQPQPPLNPIQFTATELDKVSQVYREKVQVSDWTVNHYIGTLVRYKAPELVKPLIEAFEQKIMPKDTKVVLQ
jgi:hypothetical protein